MTDVPRLTVLGSASPYPRAGNPCSGYLAEGGGAEYAVPGRTFEVAKS